MPTRNARMALEHFGYTQKKYYPGDDTAPRVGYCVKCDGLGYDDKDKDCLACDGEGIAEPMAHSGTWGIQILREGAPVVVIESVKHLDKRYGDWSCDMDRYVIRKERGGPYPLPGETLHRFQREAIRAFLMGRRGV